MLDGVRPAAEVGVDGGGCLFMGEGVRHAAEGVGARRSAAKSAIVVSVSCPTPVTTGTGQARMARATASSLKARFWVQAEIDKAQAEARSKFYLYLRQNGLWTREVTGFEPGKEKSKLDRYCPVRNVTPSYPTALLIHGTEDTDVPYDLSAAMAKELEKHQVVHELVTVPGAGHGLYASDHDALNADLVAFINGRAHAALPRNTGSQG